MSLLPDTYDAWRTWYPEPWDGDDDWDPYDDMGASDAAYERWLEE